MWFTSNFIMLHVWVFWNWLAMIWFDLFNNEQSPFPRKKSIEYIPSRYKPWELNVMQVYYGYQKSTNDCDDLFGLYTREQSIKRVPISEFPSDQHSRKKRLTFAFSESNKFIFLENEIIQKPFLHKCNMHSLYVMQIKQKIIKPLIIIMNSNKARILHSVNGNGPFYSFRIYNPIIVSFHYENHILLEQICQTT